MIKNCFAHDKKSISAKQFSILISEIYYFVSNSIISLLLFTNLVI